jgi:hypothetical protein
VCEAEHSSFGDSIKVLEQSKAWLRELHAVCGEHSFLYGDSILSVGAEHSLAMKTAHGQ